MIMTMSVSSFAGLFTPTDDRVTFLIGNEESVASMIEEHNGEKLSYYFCDELKEKYPDLGQRLTNMLDNIGEDIISITRSPCPPNNGNYLWDYNINTNESYHTYLMTMGCYFDSSHPERLGIYFLRFSKNIPGCYQGDYSKYDKPFCDMPYYYYDMISIPRNINCAYKEEIASVDFNPGEYLQHVNYVNQSLDENSGSVSVYYKSSNENVVKLTEDNKLIAVGQGTCAFDTIWVNPDGTETIIYSKVFTVEYTWWQKLIRIFLFGFLWY